MKKEKEIVREMKVFLNSKPKTYFFKTHGSPFSFFGVSDLIGVVNGKFVAIEVKVPAKEKNVTKAQMHFIKKINDCNGIAFIATSIDDILENIGTLFL